MEIKRCPFCGKKPSLGKGMRRKADNMYQKAGEWMWKPFIRCGPCGIQREGESIEQVLEWWNRRAPQR